MYSVHTTHCTVYTVDIPVCNTCYSTSTDGDTIKFGGKLKPTQETIYGKHAIKVSPGYADGQFVLDRAYMFDLGVHLKAGDEDTGEQEVVPASATARKCKLCKKSKDKKLMRAVYE